MAGIRFPQVKEEGRRIFGPEDMEGIGHPLSVARRRAQTPGVLIQTIGFAIGAKRYGVLQ